MKCPWTKKYCKLTKKDCITCSERRKRQKLLTPEPENKTVEIKIEEARVICPFCLYMDHPIRFTQFKKDGKPKKIYICPDCGNKMRKETLFIKMDVKEFAGWIYNYPSFEFWKKVDYKKFKNRLKLMGISAEFWEAYRKLKPTEEDKEREDFEDYLRWWNEQNRIQGEIQKPEN